MRIIFIALLLSSLQSCSVMAVDSNEQYLTIGQSKREVIRQLQQDGIQAVLPELTSEVYVNSSNLQDVGRLQTSNTIILRGQRFNARIHFSEDVVSNLFLSNINDGKSYGIQVGNTKDVVLSKIVSAIRGNTDLRAFNALDDWRWVKLSGASEKELDYLMSHDVWRFREPKRYSWFIVSFENDSLAQVEYQYSSGELP